MGRLLVVGGVSVDKLYLHGGMEESAGGSGVYAALAARRCGAKADLLGPCPDPCPDPLQPVSGRLGAWLGPAVPLEQLPQFEIRYRQNSIETQQMAPGAGDVFSPAMLPADLAAYGGVHICGLAGDADRQWSFVEACRQRGAAKVSAGTYVLHGSERTHSTRALLEAADVLFLDEREARSLFGSLAASRARSGQVLYITSGAQGVYVVQGEISSLVPGLPAAVLAPIGAGDAFCGATLAFLLQKEHPIMAAQRAMTLLAKMAGRVGPAALLVDGPPPAAPLDSRVRVDEERVQRVAGTLFTIDEANRYPWVGPAYPPVGHPSALEWMFAATLQQFSFWTVRDNHYDLPLIAPIDGVERKGSDYLYYAMTRQIQRDPGFCSPERQATLTRDELLDVFRADDGRDPMPALDLHLEQARCYGRNMLALGLTPQAVVDAARASAHPLDAFLLTLDHVGGYKEDPLRKKSLLLAMGLNNRPERFLPLRDDERLPPIMDYHLMRSCLRLGVIEVEDGDLRTKLVGRQLVSPEEEWAVRYAAYLAYGRVVAKSGRHPDDLNGFIFGNARQTCPEMTEPQCHVCLLDPVCAHHKEYFQPVLRTTFY